MTTQLVAEITPEGITSPSYSDIFTGLQEAFKSIYGTDAYIAPDSQDGQFLGIMAKAIHDTNQLAMSVYHSFSPASAIGEGLSNNVRINGLQRKVATRSQVILSLVGVANTPIVNGVVSDASGVKWSLPELVVLDYGGTATCLATAIDDGAITASPNTITNMVTITKGWQSVTNPTAAIPGVAVESDGQLRLRQAQSTANPAQALLKGLAGAVAAVPGVIKSRVYENDSGVVNALGHPAHSVTVVALGGAPVDIAQAIYLRKTPGVLTNGTSSVIVDDGGWPSTIRFYLATQVNVRVRVIVTPRPGYLATTETLIKQAIAAYIAGLGIGDRVDQGRLYIPAQLGGSHDLTRTFEVNGIWLTDQPLGTPLNGDLEIPFYGVAVTTLDSVEVFLA